MAAAGRLSRRALARRALGALAAAGAGAGAAQEARFFRIATGPVGGSAYVLGGLLAETVSSPPGTPPCEEGGSCGVPGLLAVAQSSSGSRANLEILGAGRAESAIVLADQAEAAERGELEAVPASLAGRLRTLAALLTAGVHLLIRPGLPVGRVADLAGRRVGLEEAGSGTEPLARRVLGAFGLAAGDVELAFLQRAPMVGAMVAGRVDALLLVGAWPLPVVEELVRDAGARLLPLTGAGLDALVRSRPYFGYHLIPFDTYPGQPAVETLGLPLLWMAASELGEELAHAVTGALWRPENRARLRAGHPQGRELAPEHTLLGPAVPLHLGAERWYREQGLLRAP